MVNVIPAPYRVETRPGQPFILASDTPIVVPTDAGGGPAWFAGELASICGITLQVDEHGSTGPAIRLAITPDDPDLATLPVPGGVRADDGDPTAERYALDVDHDGIVIRAAAPEGLTRGLATLLQIAASAPATRAGIELGPVSILDTPRFAWRGLSLDVVRRAYPVAEVEQVIDLLALYKANVLHLHLTDSEGWRIEIDAWPDLTRVSGQTAANNRPGLFYTKDDFAHLVRYAADRSITIVPEIEMPGHSAAIFRAYPELAGDGVSAPDLEQSHHFQTMHPDNPKVFPFLTDVLIEVAAMSPAAWLHIGGDEALGMDGEQYRRFMHQAMPVVRATGKKIVAWQEAARAGLEPGDIAQLWVSPGQGDPSQIDMSDLPEGFEMPPDAGALLAAFTEFLALAQTDLDAALAQGAKILVSQQSRSYLDTKYREPSASMDQAAEHRRLGMPFYPRSTVEEFYDWDPGTIRPALTEDSIAGVEAAIWAESIESLDDALFLMLPRLPGILEKGWSPAPDDTAWVSYKPRLAAQTVIWDARGWNWFRSAVVWGE